jgi:hypothetical protein
LNSEWVEGDDVMLRTRESHAVQGNRSSGKR